ncbi:MAG TPA: DUF4410 domain-containing protein [Acidobacteriaceae bacterium]|jgi:hypothetical protein|nr:DUF4410 domain-containing protein [Acidobacteriaceae bacterium]
MKYIRFASCAACILLSAFAWSQTATPTAIGQCKLVYVTDFDLDAANYKGDTSLVSKLPEAPVPRPHILRKKKETPAQRAQDLVNLMSTSLVKDLTKAGYTAQRLLADDPKPMSGWQIRGVFTDVEEGNQVRRAVFGFGSGASKMELYVNASNLAHPEQPLYTVDTQKNSGKMPGAVITLNPIVAGAKFVMEKNAPEKTIKKTATQISKDMVAKMSASDAACSN